MEHRLANPPLSPLWCFTTPLPQLLMSHTRAGKALLAWQCKPQTEMKFAEIQTVSRQLLNSPQDIADVGFGGDYSCYYCSCGTMSMWCHLQNIRVEYFLGEYSIQRSVEPKQMAQSNCNMSTALKYILNMLRPFHFSLCLVYLFNMWSQHNVITNTGLAFIHIIQHLSLVECHLVL